jgi:hypothetical protein
MTEHSSDESLDDHCEDLADVVIHDRDMDWLGEATHIVAEVTTPSLGVGYEIGRTVEMKKAVLCIFRPASGKRVSAMIAGCGDVTMREYSKIADLPRIFDEFFLA